MLLNTQMELTAIINSRCHRFVKFLLKYRKVGIKIVLNQLFTTYCSFITISLFDTLKAFCGKCGNHSRAWQLNDLFYLNGSDEKTLDVRIIRKTGNIK